MNNLNYPLRVSKNLPPPPLLFQKMNDGTEINEENIENTLAFCIDSLEAFAIKSVPRSVSKSIK